MPHEYVHKIWYLNTYIMPIIQAYYAVKGSYMWEGDGEKENSWQSHQTCTRGLRRAHAHRNTHHHCRMETTTHLGRDVCLVKTYTATL
jgi:hypothetical protein